MTTLLRYIWVYNLRSLTWSLWQSWVSCCSVVDSFEWVWSPPSNRWSCLIHYMVKMTCSWTVRAAFPKSIVSLCHQWSYDQLKLLMPLGNTTLTVSALLISRQRCSHAYSYTSIFLWIGVQLCSEIFRSRSLLMLVVWKWNVLQAHIKIVLCCTYAFGYVVLSNKTWK